MSEPVFIKIDDYKTLKTKLDSLEEKLKYSKEKLDEIVKIKGEEQELFDSWEKVLNDIDDKIKKTKGMIKKD
ncbi:MAG: hypothetical protein PWQ28_36 [Candidatus Woesearchaeota archaeon]|nr:hypothetical protein [Candidatus Woesearchaeota archaeon]MDK2907689.1 hypothetical protein [Candidatus Woesearchaeota archaeon]